MKTIKKLLLNIEQRWAKTSNNRYISYLKRRGVHIGSNTIFFGGIKNFNIDLTRPSLIEIGDNVAFNKNFTLLTHDFFSKVFVNKYHEFLPSSGRVKIGNNVSFGQNCTVLKNVTIGDNCFIGYGSVVTKNIPSNSIAVGSPAKIVSTLEDYYEKRKKLCINEAFEYARSIKERFNRKPVLEDFWEEFPLFLNGNEDEPKLPIKAQLEGSYIEYYKNHKATFKGFDDFISKARLH